MAPLAGLVLSVIYIALVLLVFMMMFGAYIERRRRAWGSCPDCGRPRMKPPVST